MIYADVTDVLNLFAQQSSCEGGDGGEGFQFDASFTFVSNLFSVPLLFIWWIQLINLSQLFKFL